MEFFKRLRAPSNQPGTGMHLTLQVDAPLAGQLVQLAEREHTSLQLLAEALLQEAVLQRLAAGRAVERWRALSPREQEVCALVCLGLTNPQIAARLVLSADTIKAHVRSILIKFGMSSRKELRQALEGWDFSAWEEGRI